MTSVIRYSDSGTSFVGPDAVQVFRCRAIASALRLYAATGMQANRAYTPKAMMAAATQITGVVFKARDYAGAAAALTSHADTLQSTIPAEVVGGGE
jgi:hypothetical protein